MAGPGCHTGRYHCYFNLYDPASDSFLEQESLPFESGGGSEKLLD